METTIRHSRSTGANPKIEDWSKDYEKKDNLRFFADAFAALGKAGVGNGGLMVIGLVGSRDLPGVTLRQAQALLRWDMRPSLWSHAFLITNRVSGASGVPRAKTLGVSVHSRTAEFPNPECNGVSSGTLKLYEDSKVDANVGLFAVNMTDEEADRVAYRAAHQNLDRQRYNLWESLGVWQGFLWSFGVRPNPLREGFPIPSASFLEYCYEGIGLDLTPGASERNSAPEHIYNAAKYWHDAFKTQERFVTGYYALRDKGCSLLSAED